MKKIFKTLAIGIAVIVLAVLCALANQWLNLMAAR